MKFYLVLGRWTSNFIKKKEVLFHILEVQWQTIITSKTVIERTKAFKDYQKAAGGMWAFDHFGRR